MKKTILKKIVLLILSFLVIYLINFIIPRCMPGDPFDYTSSVSGEDVDIEVSTEQKAYMRAYYGLDKSLPLQLKDTIKLNIKGDLGESIHYKKPVLEIIKERLPYTLLIMLSTLLISFILGTITALFSSERDKRGRLLYNVFSFIAEIPPYIIGIFLLFTVAVKIKFIPISGAFTPFMRYSSATERIYDLFIHSLIPVTSMCIVTIPRFYFIAHTSFADIRKKLYVENAKLKGIGAARIYYRYILLNGITPVVVKLFLSVGSMLGSTILIENVFAYPGLGLVMREAVRYRDYPLVQGIFLTSGVLTIISLFIADIINAAISKETIV